MWDEPGHQKSPYGEDGEPAEPLVSWPQLAFRFFVALAVCVALVWVAA